MATIELSANGSTTETELRDVGQVYCVTCRGDLGGGALNVKLRARDGVAKTVDSYIASDLNADETIAFEIDVAADNGLQIELAGATAPSVIIDVDLFSTQRTN